MAEHRFDKSKRLLCAADFGRVFDSAKFRASNRNLLILANSNILGHGRLGCVIAKKNVRLAAQRNRIKRVIREFFRLNPGVFANLDVVILVRRGLDERSNSQIRQLLARLCVELQNPR